MYGAEKILENKIVLKLINDPNSLSTTLLINPEVLNEASPTIPVGFPKSLIPKEICEVQMKHLLSCMLENKMDNVECEDFQFKFYECKKWRDALIFKRIKDWEINTFDKMNEKEKTEHIDSLKIKKIEFINHYDSIEVTPKNRNKKFRVSSDIEQVNWRLKYLEDVYNNTFSI